MGSTTPNSHSFLNLTGGAGTIDPGTKFVISGTPTPALDTATSYSYRIATGTGDQSLLSITSSTQFDASGLTGGAAFTYSVTGDNVGPGNVYLNLTPVPEPATVLGLAAAGLSLAGWVRRVRRHA